MSEPLDFKRKTQADWARQATGVIGQSQRFALLAPSQHEQERNSPEALGQYAKTQRPLQDAQGRFYFMSGYDTPGDPDHPVRP